MISIAKHSRPRVKYYTVVAQTAQITESCTLQAQSWQCPMQFLTYATVMSRTNLLCEDCCETIWALSGSRDFYWLQKLCLKSAAASPSQLARDQRPALESKQTS